MKKVIMYLLLGMLTGLSSCSSSRMIAVNKVKSGKTVRIYLKSGEKFDGLLFNKEESNLIVISKDTHKEIRVPEQQIRRIDYLNEYLDYQGNPISKAEVKKYKGNKNSFTYTVGGFVLGGIGGVVVGLPLWYMDTGVKPFFTGGIGAVAGGIFFGFKGNQRDEERAVETIRILRDKRKQIRKDTEEKEAEMEKLKKIEEEKQILKDKLKQKNK